jgi:hypothetical protein
MKKHHIKTMIALLAASTATWLTAAPASAVGPYVEPIGSAYQITPILSVADQVPETSDPSRQYQMVGIPGWSRRLCQARWHDRAPLEP